ncbi:MULTISPECIES: YciI family protein [Brevibacterium]|uniref:Uncharacterized conserved protein n=1 Tax=Brevibacterium antiquum CNRZ 918 TaxID=1255637 RepID=A0A2H1I8F7_9MICO|nr:MULTISPECIES: YciI family protein [Brevibacterium]SMX71491.1 Uncharacterized conserved protein [Brevibacterium antiquum CNRZ 918]HCG54619.1 hypothetical protein [Brevibacterium sp.]
MRYSLIFHAPEPQGGDPQPSPEVMEEMQKLMTDYADALDSAGVFIAAEMFEPQQATTTVTRRGGSVVIEDGPFAATKEALVGVFVIDVESGNGALAWAEKFPGTNYGVVEVRAAAVSYIDGRWVHAQASQ